MDDAMGTVIALRNPDEIAALPVEQQGKMVTLALQESKSWLATAVKATDPTQVQAFKAWAATVAEMVHQRQLSEEIQMDAQEMMRRAERGVTLVVREGQRSDPPTVRRTGNNPGSTNDTSTLPPPSGFYASKREQVDSYDMTDGVRDAAFEEALEEARAEGNLSRRNVARKSRQRSGRETVPRDTHPIIDLPDYSTEVGPPTCVEVIFREEMLKRIRAWADAGIELIKGLSLHERDEMLKALVRLEKDLRAMPPPDFKES
jgi:hypothetical protein